MLRKGRQSALDGQRGGFPPIAHLKLGEDVRDVRLDGAWADEKRLCHFQVRKALTQQRQDFELAPAQLRVLPSVIRNRSGVL